MARNFPNVPSRRSQSGAACFSAPMPAYPAETGRNMLAPRSNARCRQDGGLRCFDAQFQSTVALVTLALPRAAMSQSNTASQMDRQPAQLPI